MMTDYCIVFVMVGSADEALQIGRAVVEERLAACANIVRGLWSIFHWQGKIETADETLLILKTQRRVFERLQARVKELHSYEVPEIIALPIEAGLMAYLNWVGEETQAATEKPET